MNPKIEHIYNYWAPFIPVIGNGTARVVVIVVVLVDNDDNDEDDDEDNDDA
jgi:hypothetical protein